MTRFLNTGLPVGGYPSRLLRLRQFFDMPGSPVLGEPGYYQQPEGPITGWLPVKRDPSGIESPAIPANIRGTAQQIFDILASTRTGTLPESTVADVALNALGGAPETSVLRTFLGVKSKTANTAKLQLANMLERRGANPDKIRLETGWERDAGGKWRYRISDQPAQYTPEAAFKKAANEPGGQGELFKLDRKTLNARVRQLKKEGINTTAGEVFQHPELYAAHPELAGRPVRLMGTEEPQYLADPNILGYNDPVTGEIGIGPAFNTAKGTYTTQAGQTMGGKSVMLHELAGHGVQNIEGFPSGASTGHYQMINQDGDIANIALGYREMAQRIGRDNAVSYYDNQMDNLRYSPALRQRVWNVANDTRFTNQDLQDRIDFRDHVKATTQGPAEAYHKTAGEVAARSIQRTMDLSQQELNALPASAIEDVPRNQQLIIPQRQLDYMQERSTGALPLRDELRNQVVLPDPSLTEPGGLTTRGQVLQTPLQRDVGRGPSPRVGDLINDPKLARKLEPYFKKGQDVGMRWYDAQPELQALMQGPLGESKGYDEFMRRMDFMGATSPLSDVLSNIRNASHYRYLAEQLKQGNIERLPQATFDPVKKVWRGETQPTPYNTTGNPLIQNTLNRMLEEGKLYTGGFDYPLSQPKQPSFAGALQGNQMNVPVDTHNFRLAGVISKDPRFLTPEARKAGVTPETAKPTDWANVPSQPEYAAWEGAQRAIALKKGVPPASYQASLWGGAGPLTGLKTEANATYVDLLNQVINRTAQARGISPEEAFRRDQLGIEPLLAQANPFGPRIGQAPPVKPLELTITTPRGPGMDQNRLLQIMGYQS